MTGKPRTPAYFAVARSIFDHPLFTHGRRAYSRREAWEWLIAQAAWKAKGHRYWLGVIDIQRGQLTASVRELAAAWRWPATNAHRFLHRLEREGMVSLAKMCNLNATGTAAAIAPERARHIITICNYDRFQSVNRSREQRPEQRPEQEWPSLPGLLPSTAVLTTFNHQESVSKQEAANKRLRPANNMDKSKPPHGARNRKARVQWFDYGTLEWKAAVEFDREMRGTETYPVRYRDGRGNWFKERGESEWREWGRKVSGRR